MPIKQTDETLPAVRDPERLDAVRATGLLGSPAEEDFDRLTRLAARLTGAPVTFISVVSDDRDFYKSCFGFPEPLASEREIQGTTFCHYALVSAGPLIIESTLDHPIYRTVPTVQSLGVQAYLGVPLVTSTGQAIGSFCAIDFKPRKWSPLDVEVMVELAASTLREIELRSALRSVDEGERRLRVLLQQIPVGVVFAEAPSGETRMRNRQALEILGEPQLPSGGIAGYGEPAGFFGDGRPVAPDQWPMARALRGEIVLSEEILIQRADRRQIWLRMHSAPVRDAEGSIIGGVVAFHDIDKERLMAMENARLYQDAQQANRAKDEFFAAVSHELRTPMTAIIGWARMLKMEDLDRAESADAVEAIISSARLQAQLVDDLLDVSRIATGKLSLNCEALAVNAAVSESVLGAHPIAQSKGVSVHTRLGVDGTIHADLGRIRQILGNLLSNALKFTPIGGLVEVSTHTSDGLATIVVSDTGRGIEPALLPHIFDRFRQAKSAEQGGLGLGLAIVKHLVELHGGDVRAESDGAGKGARFTVRLPLANLS